MPRALPLPVREEIVRLRQAGHSYADIAARTGQNPRSVRAIWTRFRQLGLAGLVPSYARCGTKCRRFAPAVSEAAVALKRDHPRWGAGLIRLELAAQFPAAPLPSRRTLQAWFQQAGLQPGRTSRPSAPRDWAREAHAVWQLDGKEGMRLADGTPTVALNVVDEATGVLLSTAVFPPREVQSSVRPRGPDVAGAGVPGLGPTGPRAGG